MFSAVFTDMGYLQRVHAWSWCKGNSQAGHPILADSQYSLTSKGLPFVLQCRVQFHVHFDVQSDRPPLALCMCPVDYILVHLGPEESWVRVFLHEAVDFALDLVEAGWRRICQTRLCLLPGTVVNVYLSGKRHRSSRKRLKMHFIFYCINFTFTIIWNIRLFSNNDIQTKIIAYNHPIKYIHTSTDFQNRPCKIHLWFDSHFIQYH